MAVVPAQAFDIENKMGKLKPLIIVVIILALSLFSGVFLIHNDHDIMVDLIYKSQPVETSVGKFVLGFFWAGFFIGILLCLAICVVMGLELSATRRESRKLAKQLEKLRERLKDPT